MDHPLKDFFDHNFEAYSFFDLVEFRQQCTQGTANTDLLYAMCAAASRYSDHPAMVKTPPSSAGDAYVHGAHGSEDGAGTGTPSALRTGQLIRY